MDKESLFCIFPVHSAAVIGYTDKRDSAASKFHGHSCGAAVYRVIDKLLYNGDRTFDNLAGLDGIGGLGV